VTVAASTAKGSGNSSPVPAGHWQKKKAGPPEKAGRRAVMSAEANSWNNTGGGG